VLKLFIGGLLSGSLANPAFFIGAGAGMCSWLIMSAARVLGRSIFSAVGLGIWGAVTHQLAQLALAYIYIGQWGMWTLLPVALLGGLISGILIGLLAHWVHDRSV
jgi:heptaprenyl diphosphate synthase